MKSIGLFSRNLRGDFFLKIGILSVKVYTKKVPNIEEYKFIQVPLIFGWPKPWYNLNWVIVSKLFKDQNGRNTVGGGGGK